MSVGVALAGDLVPNYDTGSRTIKIDVFDYDPAVRPRRDMRDVFLEQWSAVITCTPQQARIEQCVYRNNEFQYGVLLRGEGEQIRWKTFPAPGAFELVFDKRGGLKAFDLQGHSDAFLSSYPEWFREAVYTTKVELKGERLRVWGQGLEEDVTRRFAGPHDWALPKDGAVASYRLRRPVCGSFTGLRAGGGADLTVTVEMEQPDQIGLSVQGSVSSVTSGNVAATTQVRGRMVFDRTLGRVTGALCDGHTTSTYTPIPGHTRHAVLMMPWKEGDSVEPAGLPATTLQGGR